MKKILITGGLGYIGSIFSVSAISHQYNINIVDNLSNSDISVLDKLKKITNQEILFNNCDIRDLEKIENIFSNYRPDIIMHFAGLKSVRESEIKKEEYYNVNVLATENLLKLANKYNVERFVFSSSASVYGNPEYLPLNELHPINPISYYGNNKADCEKLMQKYSTDNMKCIALRYFNVVGASLDGLLYDKLENANNLIPIIFNNILGKTDKIKIFGNDYDTKDGTAERDYINVLDIVNAHILSINANLQNNFEAINISTGEASSCKKILNIVEEITNQKINYIYDTRRVGDPAVSFAENIKAKNILNWTPQYNIRESIEIAYNAIK